MLWPREENIIFVANGSLNSGIISIHDVKKSVPTNTEDYQEIVSTKKDISTVKEFRISFKRIPKVDRVVEIQCDQLAESFVVLQVKKGIFKFVKMFIIQQNRLLGTFTTIFRHTEVSRRFTDFQKPHGRSVGK